MYLKCHVNSYCDHSEQSDEEYGWSEESWSQDFSHVTISPNNYGEAIDFDAKVGDTVYVIFAVWSDGDSFSHRSGYRSDVVHVFKDKKVAELALEAIRDEQIEFYKSDSGISVHIDRPWIGYFESLDSIDLIKTVIRKK